MTDKRLKRFRREHREKSGTWACGNCGSRHEHGRRCPHPKRGDLRFSGLSLHDQLLVASLTR